MSPGKGRARLQAGTSRTGRVGEFCPHPAQPGHRGIRAADPGRADHKTVVLRVLGKALGKPKNFLCVCGSSCV